MNTVAFILVLLTWVATAPITTGAQAGVAVGQTSPSFRNSPAQSQVLADYLKAHWQTPEDYVISTFATHNIVFLGEHHRIKHDVELVQHLIPRLHKAGVYVLAIEFAATEEQARIDRLLSGEAYDETAAREIMFDSDPTWGYVEYENILKAAWELNHSLPKGARRFRIIALTYEPRYELLTESDDLNTSLPERVFYKGDYDAFMAGVILREIVDKNDKALVYTGLHHAFTRYRRKINRTGNIVYDRIGNNAFTIALHMPWPSDPYERSVYPVNGAIDQVMSGFPDKRVGFDLVNSPFGALDATGSFYAYGRSGFHLSDWADGYIFQKRIKDYQGCSVDRLFITEMNINAFIAKYPNTKARKFLTVQSALEAMREDADLQRRFKDLQ
jgi:hypothetical protein